MYTGAGAHGGAGISGNIRNSHGMQSDYIDLVKKAVVRVPVRIRQIRCQSEPSNLSQVDTYMSWCTYIHSGESMPWCTLKAIQS